MLFPDTIRYFALFAQVLSVFFQRLSLAFFLLLPVGELSQRHGAAGHVGLALRFGSFAMCNVGYDP